VVRKSGALFLIDLSRFWRIDLAATRGRFSFPQSIGHSFPAGSAPLDLLKEYTMQHFQFARLVPDRGAGASIANDPQMFQSQGIADLTNGSLGEGRLKGQLSATNAHSVRSHLRSRTERAYSTAQPGDAPASRTRWSGVNSEQPSA
jgi:hypothetical protein